MGEMICPECMGPLATLDGKIARCTVHGGTYRILFWRGLRLPGPPSAAAGYPPAATPPATTLAGEGDLQGAGSAALPTPSMASPPSLATTASASIPPVSSEPSPPRCYLHPIVRAVHTCRVCGRPICRTCDFAFPMSVEQPSGVLALGSTRQISYHLCPRCAAAPKQDLSSPRKKYLVWSYVLAVWSTLALLVLLALAHTMKTKEDLDAFGTVMTYLILLPSLIGMGLGAAAIDRRLANPFSVKVAAVWNGAILGIFILLVIIGLLRSA